MSGTEIPRDQAGRVLRPKPSQLLADVMEALGPDHLTTRTLMAALIERDRGASVEPRAVSPKYGWHLPVLADPPNVPYDLQELTLDIEGSDTGYRNINSTLVNGWAAASSGLWLRRIGGVCILRASYLSSPATYNANLTGAPSLFAGFTSPNGSPIYATMYLTAGGVITANHMAVGNGAAFLSIAGPAVAAGTAIRLTATYLTEDTWPTSLPGTPALFRGELLDDDDGAQPR